MKRLAVAIFVLVVLGVVVFPVQAKPSDLEFSEADLSALAERIVGSWSSGEAMPEEDVATLYRLSEKEAMRLVTLVLVLQGYTPEEAQQGIDHMREESAAPRRGGAAPLLGGPCTQNVELQDGGNQVGCSQVRENWTCDGDSSDLDYQFNFPMYWYGDPDLIRWWTWDPWIRWLWSQTWVYGGNLLGYNLCYHPKYLCIGQWGVTAAGGPTIVKDVLKLRHN